ncbi:DUF397 domain-containing protein [Phytomonospora endophytica]|uniref:DUF397 domain-containing protein n=1 Tax=Phytomonospora endophytica TaxID=714109 RepID=A0A841FBG4_9ACTN|nr:DUF397 domain-containing protein [Phytomonospora endophytica]MBB6033124.1 hypothetical protein [Phytomonospora endophytica]GIG65351.1 toxin [Phytomonospora endophytica]
MTQFVWRKSSHSTGNGGACLEAAWRKSSHSHGNGGNCVEVAAPSAVLIRDSKLAAFPTCPVLTVDRETWRGFITGLA